MMMERRLSPRIPYFETVSIQKMDKASVAHGHTLEISVQGIGLCSDISLQPRQQCRIALVLNAPNEMRKLVLLCETGTCRVTEDCRSYRVGMSFVEIGSEEVGLIGRHVQSMADQSI